MTPIAWAVYTWIVMASAQYTTLDVCEQVRTGILLQEGPDFKGTCRPIYESNGRPIYRTLNEAQEGK